MMRILPQNPRAHTGANRAGNAGGADASPQEPQTVPPADTSIIRDLLAMDCLDRAVRRRRTDLPHFANLRNGELVQGRASGSLGWAIVWGAIGLMVILLAPKTLPQLAHDAASCPTLYTEGC